MTLVLDDNSEIRGITIESGQYKSEMAFYYNLNIDLFSNYV